MTDSLTANQISRSLLAGSVGGTFGCIVGHPFEVIKSRSQLRHNMRYTPFELGFKLIKYEGYKSFYKGLSAPVLMVGFQKAWSFTVNHHLRIMLGLNHKSTINTKDTLGGKIVKDSEKGKTLLAGALTGLLNSLVQNPIDVLKIRLQTKTQASKFRNLPKKKIAKNVAKYTLSNQVVELGRRGIGLKVPGLYRGFLICAIRDTVALMAYFPGFQLGNSYIREHWDCESSPWRRIASIAISGGIAGSLSWTIQLPMDVIKTRIQADKLDNPKYDGVLDTINKSVKKDGYRIFFRGMTPALMRAFPTHCTVFLVYEVIMYTLEQLKDKNRPASI